MSSNKKEIAKKVKNKFLNKEQCESCDNEVANYKCKECDMLFCEKCASAECFICPCCAPELVEI